MKFMPLFLKYIDPKEGKNVFFTTYDLKTEIFSFNLIMGRNMYSVRV